MLRPNGRVLILEITPPRSRLGYAVLRFHLNRIVPFFARIRSRSAEAEKLMHYYWDTIRSCVPPETILDALPLPVSMTRSGMWSWGRSVSTRGSVGVMRDR